MAKWTYNGFAHGAEYNPDQWLDTPEIIQEDIRMMKLAHVNMVTLGTFSWAALEKEEGVYNFDWLDEIFNLLHENRISVILSTPSGARPAWLSASYPEVLRVGENRLRNLHGMRMNHCYTSPKYRELTAKIDKKLSEHYGLHPTLKAWHISNEFHGECHCDLCQAAFRKFLEKKYGDLDLLNRAWWTGFWSKTYTDWSQIESPSSRGEKALQGLEVDWLRFVTDQTCDFMQNEIDAVQSFSANIPVTTNMIGSFIEVDYPKLATKLDIASLDVYPEWGSQSNERIAAQAGFEFDITRSLKKEPFLLMETTPSMTNWSEVGKMKPPGMHLAGCLQAIAHGAESIMYFQWRKSRGGFEKFHGAVVGHNGSEHTRIFRETSQLGETLSRIGEIAGSCTHSEIAILFDWNNRWAVNVSKGPRAVKPHDDIALEHYLALKQLGLDLDIIDQDQSFEDYKLIIAPMMYMVKNGVANKIESFVKKGGHFVTTYFSGIVDDNDLCFLEGFPEKLKSVLGIWSEELDTLYPDEKNEICFLKQNNLHMKGIYSCDYFCDIIHLETAEAVAVYGGNYYKNTPALTMNRCGAGRGWYIAAHTGVDFLKAFYKQIIKETGIIPLLDDVPPLVWVNSRQRDGVKYLFVTNFGDKKVALKLPKGKDFLGGDITEGETSIEKYGVRIIRLETDAKQESHPEQND